VRYELGFYIPEDDILHNHRRDQLKSSIHELHSVTVSTFRPKAQISVTLQWLRVPLASQFRASVLVSWFEPLNSWHEGTFVYSHIVPWQFILFGFVAFQKNKPCLVFKKLMFSFY
jgi:hypothetical protein